MSWKYMKWIMIVNASVSVRTCHMNESLNIYLSKSVFHYAFLLSEALIQSVYMPVQELILPQNNIQMFPPL